MSDPNKFLLFAGSDHYPLGGFADFIAAFSSEKEAILAAANIHCDWWHVVDTGIVIPVSYPYVPNAKALPPKIVVEGKRN
jgi:hypothetical protein